MAVNLKNEVSAAEAADTEALKAAEDAKALAEKAQEEHDAVEESIRQGDETLTPEDLNKSRGLLQFAKLRQEAADRKASSAAREKELAQQRLAVDEAVKLARNLPGNEPALDKLLDGAVSAVREYLDAAATMHEGALSVALAIGNAGPKAEELGLPTPADHGITIEPERIIVESRGGQKAFVVLGDYTLKSAARELFERADLLTAGGYVDGLKREYIEGILPCNSVRFDRL